MMSCSNLRFRSAPGNGVRTRASNRDERIVRLILAAGADPNQADRGGTTPIMLAVQHGVDDQPAHTPQVRAFPPLPLLLVVFFLGGGFLDGGFGPSEITVAHGFSPHVSSPVSSLAA